jgi:LysM repeat protein
LLLTILVYNVKSEEAFYPESSFFSQEPDFFLHTIERGQTVYSIASMYHVTVDEIYALNPDSSKGIQAGNTLKIPQISGSYFYHTIEPKETLYSVSRQYQMTGEDIVAVNPGLSIETFTAGKIIRIPTNKVTDSIKDTNNYNVQHTTNALLNPQETEQKIEKIKAALLLPLGLKEGTTANNASKNRIVEYYEGILLALDDLRKKGISVNLQVYDIGSKMDILPTVLKKTEIQDVDLLIGGLSDEQIKAISHFTTEKKILYVIPFTSKSNEPLNNHSVYQINTPQSHLFAKTSLAFCNKYKHFNIIFFDLKKDSESSLLTETMKVDLDAKKIAYKFVYSTDEFEKAIKSGTNNVFIPTDDSMETLMQLINQLKILGEKDPSTSLSMFGYPSWQIYSVKYSADFFRLKTCFYSSFYANPVSQNVKAFHAKYRRWFSRDLINKYPRYGILGYDTGMFFLQLLDSYGTSYDVNINKLNYKGVQTDFYFEQVNNWGGFINTNVYFVEFNPDYTITSNRIDHK